jgi:DnaJ-class molecular chaperone
MPESPFEILGLPDTASPTQVRAAYRLKVATPGVHPDLGGSSEAFEALRSAYQRALHIAENAPCPDCRGTGKVGTGESSFVKTLMRCMTCRGSGKRG